MARQIDLFEVLDPNDPNFEKHTCKNPMVRAQGFGPEGAKCKTCKFLYYREESKRFFKCEYRGDTRGPKTDHRVNWPACKLYEEDLPYYSR